jgi:hypothetical protein
MAPVSPSVRSSSLKRVVMRTSVGWLPPGDMCWGGGGAQQNKKGMWYIVNMEAGGHAHICGVAATWSHGQGGGLGAGQGGGQQETRGDGSRQHQCCLMGALRHHTSCAASHRALLRR